jgi:hypothetical protein
MRFQAARTPPPPLGSSDLLYDELPSRGWSVFQRTHFRFPLRDELVSCLAAGIFWKRTAGSCPPSSGLNRQPLHDGLRTRAGGSGPKRLVGACNNRKDYDLRMVTDPVDRAEEFIQLFNQVETFLSLVVGPKKHLAFAQLVDAASVHNAAVRANRSHLKQFAKLRNAIVHDAEYPPHIVAVPSEETLLRFKGIAHEVLEPSPLIPMFATQVRCFPPSDSLSGVLRFMRKHDFSQVIVRGNDRRLNMLTVEGITKWLADNLDDKQNSASNAALDGVLPLEPPGGFMIMGPNKTIFDAVDAFSNAIHFKATRLYAIAITKNGGDSDDPIGFVTPWDLLHNPRLAEEG